jgi:hypothetical protein
LDCGHVPAPLATTPEAWAAYNTIMDRMDGPARLRVAGELSEAVGEIRLAGIRARHPELSAQRALARLMREEYGADPTEGR